MEDQFGCNTIHFCVSWFHSNCHMVLYTLKMVKRTYFEVIDLNMYIM
jgi:hypothetical protein